jgi:hypothetical protein
LLRSFIAERLDGYICSVQPLSHAEALANATRLDDDKKNSKLPLNVQPLAILRLRKLYRPAVQKINGQTLQKHSSRR